MYYDVFVKWSVIYVFFFSSRRRHTRCALVTGVQTCALPILPTRHTRRLPSLRRQTIPAYTPPPFAARSQKRGPLVNIYFILIRSEGRRVGKECVSTCMSRRSPVHSKKKQYILNTSKGVLNMKRSLTD